MEPLKRPARALAAVLSRLCKEWEPKTALILREKHQRLLCAQLGMEKTCSVLVLGCLSL